MKKAMLLLCLSLFLSSDVQAHVPGEEAGQVDWKTTLILLCVAFLVYWINKSKRQDVD